MEEIVKLINECNGVRYPSYRAAQKLQILQKELNMQYIQLELIAGVFECHRLSVTENTLTLDIYEVEDVLSDIYFAAGKEAKVTFSVSQATKLVVNYICKLFNADSRSSIPVISLKIVLVLTCCGKLEHKYGYLFHELADHNACLSKIALHTLLVNVCKVIEVIGESVSFGSHLIQSTVDDCFEQSPGCLGITEAQFATWLRKDPILLTWLSTFNRLKWAENIVHDVKCSTCKMSPLTGPRYACLRCSDYNQCQSCFYLGKVSGKHKLKHPVREYCTKTSDKEVSKILMKLIRSKLKICAAQDTASRAEQVCSNIKKDKLIENNDTTTKFDDPQTELQSIINQLEKQNEQLQAELAGINDTKAEKIENYRSAIEMQLARLKEFKNCLFTQSDPIVDLNLVQSTPMIRPISSRVRPLPLAFELSPIICHDTAECDNSQVNSHIYNSREDEGLATSREITSASNVNVESSEINLSTWLGGGEKTRIETQDSGFSQWIESKGNDSKETRDIAKSSGRNWIPSAEPSPDDVLYNNAVSSLQRAEKNSQHSSLQNVQGDLKDILDRLQNMVANDSTFEDKCKDRNKNKDDLEATCFI